MRRFLCAAAVAAAGSVSTDVFAAPPAGAPAEEIAVVSIEASGPTAACAALAEAYDISTPSPASADAFAQAQALRREGSMLCSRDMERAGALYLSSAIKSLVGTRAQ